MGNAFDDDELDGLDDYGIKRKGRPPNKKPQDEMNMDEDAYMDDY